MSTEIFSIFALGKYGPWKGRCGLSPMPQKKENKSRLTDDKKAVTQFVMMGVGKEEDICKETGILGSLKNALLSEEQKRKDDTRRGDEHANNV